LFSCAKIGKEKIIITIRHTALLLINRRFGKQIY
jgi:hypothetical protein